LGKKIGVSVAMEVLPPPKIFSSLFHRPGTAKIHKEIDYVVHLDCAWEPCNERRDDKEAWSLLERTSRR